MTEGKERGEYPTIHTLTPLWEQVKLIIDEYSNDDFISKKEIKKSEEIINRFDEIDPNSFSFRYDKDKKGSKNLESLSYVNIQNNARVINQLHEVLEKVYSMVDYNC